MHDACDACARVRARARAHQCAPLLRCAWCARSVCVGVPRSLHALCIARTVVCPVRVVPHVRCARVAGQTCACVLRVVCACVCTCGACVLPGGGGALRRRVLECVLGRSALAPVALPPRRHALPLRPLFTRPARLPSAGTHSIPLPIHHSTPYPSASHWSTHCPSALHCSTLCTIWPQC